MADFLGAHVGLSDKKASVCVGGAVDLWDAANAHTANGVCEGADERLKAPGQDGDGSSSSLIGNRQMSWYSDRGKAFWDRQTW